MGKKNAKNKQMKAPMNKNTKILIYALSGIVFLAIIAIILVESSPSRFIAKNKTGKTLEYVKAYFVDAEGQFTDTMELEDLKNGDSKSIDLNRIDLSYTAANLEIRFKFEGYDELFVDAGYFNDVFDGSIKISFMDDDGNVLLHVKASSGVLPNPNIDCNEEYTVNLEEGYVDN